MPKQSDAKGIFKKFWAITAATTNVSAPITSPKSVIVFPIPRELLVRTAVSFMNFDAEKPVASHYMMLFQALLYATWKMKDIAIERGLKIDHIAQARLETIFSNEPENPAVLGYRLWIFVTNQEVSLGDGIEKLLAENATLHSKSEGSISFTAQKGGQQRVTLPGQTDWTTKLQPHERYRLIKDKDMWATKLCDMYINFNRMATKLDETKLKVLQAKLWEETPGLKEAWEAYNQEATTEANSEDTASSRLSPPELQLRATILREDLLNNEPHEDERPFQENSLLSTHLDIASELLNNRVYQYYFTSDFCMLREENLHRLKALGAIKDGPTYKLERDKFKAEAFAAFEARCWGGNSDISDIGHIIRTFGTRPDVQKFRIKHIKFDPKLSVFGNMVARKMEAYDDFFFISSAHKHFFVMDHAKLDAYRHSNNLHFNVLSTGMGGTSKSFSFAQLVKTSIEGTVEEIAYETPKANAIDRDNNDTIIIMNEIPEEMTRQKIGGSGMQSSFKERLTSLKVKVKLFQKDDTTGFRDQRTSVSECIGVWFGASNDDFSKIDEALLTRFYQAFFTEYQREERGITNLMLASGGLKESEKKKQSEFRMESKIEQYRYYLVEKLIMTQCLEDFDNSTAQIFFSKFLGMLRDDGYHPHSRTLERMLIMTRILSICHGLECLFNIPTGPYYDKPFEISQLRDIEPFLHPTNEILHFVCGLFDDQLVNPVENNVLQAVKHIHFNTGAKNARRFREYPVSSEDVTSPNLATSRTPEGGSSEDVTSPNLATSRTPEGGSSGGVTRDDLVREEASRGGAAAMFANFSLPQDGNLVKPASIVQKKKLDYNYIAFNKTLTQTAEEIYRTMEKETTRPSTNQIKSVIVNLKQRSILSKNFERKDLKQTEPELDHSSEPKSYAAVVTDFMSVCFHYSLLLQENTAKGKIADYLTRMWYRETLPERLVYGVVVEGHPQLFQTLDARPGTERLVIYNVLHINKLARLMLYNNDMEAVEDESRRGPEMEIPDMDLDSHSLMVQLDRLELPWNDESILRYHPYHISARENAWLIKHFGEEEKNGKRSIKNTFTYYQDFLELHNKRKDKYAEACKVGEQIRQNEESNSSNRKRTRFSEQTAEIFRKSDLFKRAKNDMYDFAVIADLESMQIDVQAPVSIQAVDPSMVVVNQAAEPPGQIIKDIVPGAAVEPNEESNEYWARRAAVGSTNATRTKGVSEKTATEGFSSTDWDF